MAKVITNENVRDINALATYDVFYVENLRTGIKRQFAIMSGDQLRFAFEHSADPRRIRAITAN